ncbi:acyl-CoA dehydrogenase family protein [Nocardia wallacei]|uniref:acyl-CoA dehydrogenase family protein n=1 Tax=Nocardia wallacei TaxID=480035 RepID=UPI002458152F|nr:acyl-CoA dehydrogenase family protein [Nocardia wallacei]
MNPTLPEALDTWLTPLRGVADPGGHLDWDRLSTLACALDDRVARHPIGPDLEPGARRSARLRAIRAELARGGVLDTAGQPALFAVLAQFLCGYRDIDLRDATGLGHGALIARHAGPAIRRRWIPRLLAGELAGIAITEPHGGSNPAATRTSATTTTDGTWLVTGRKTWISRLTEAAVFVVFLRDPHGELAAVVVDATTPGMHRHDIPPAGLSGWTWGILDLDHVPVQPAHVLHGEGMMLLRHHFAHYRPLVAATGLGGAAAVFDTVRTALGVRHATGDIARVRDSALITIGRAHAQLTTALLGTITAAGLADTGHPDAERWSAEMKAHGIDIANQATADLAVLVGAPGFRADSQLAKARRDLGGLLYADGIHDSLFRAAGKQHTTQPRTTAVTTDASEADSLPLSA